VVSAAKSVAVLPFADMSPDGDQEYFGDGITEEILNTLVQLPELRVPARTSSFSFKGKNLPVGEIAKQLGVAHILEGSVRKSGDRVRITAQLIDARTDKHVWSQQYDRALDDVFAVQAGIARAIVEALQVQFTSGPDALLAGQTGDGRAHHSATRRPNLGRGGARQGRDVFVHAAEDGAGMRRDRVFPQSEKPLKLIRKVGPELARGRASFRKNGRDQGRALRLITARSGSPRPTGIKPRYRTTNGAKNAACAGGKRPRRCTPSSHCSSL
jgi:TolB-like protein